MSARHAGDALDKLPRELYHCIGQPGCGKDDNQKNGNNFRHKGQRHFLNLRYGLKQGNENADDERNQQHRQGKQQHHVQTLCAKMDDVVHVHIYGAAKAGPALPGGYLKGIQSPDSNRFAASASNEFGCSRSNRMSVVFASAILPC